MSVEQISPPEAPAEPGCKPLRRRRHNCDPERFCQELLAGVALSDAYQLAGFKRPNGNAQRLEREPAIIARIDYLRRQLDGEHARLLAIRRNRTRRILESYRDLDRSAMFNDDGSFKSLDQLSDEHRLLIESIEITKHGVKVAMPSKMAATAQLAKLDGLEAPTQIQQSGKDGGPIVQEHHVVRLPSPVDDIAAWARQHQGDVSLDLPYTRGMVP